MPKCSILGALYKKRCFSIFFIRCKFQRGKISFFTSVSEISVVCASGIGGNWWKLTFYGYKRITPRLSWSMVGRNGEILIKIQTLLAELYHYISSEALQQGMSNVFVPPEKN